MAIHKMLGDTLKFKKENNGNILLKNIVILKLSGKTISHAESLNDSLNKPGTI